MGSARARRTHMAGVVERVGPRIFRLMGELDASNVGDVSILLDEEILRGGNLTIDLSELTFVDSMGVGLLATAAEKIAGRGDLILVSPDHSVRRILELVQIHQRANVKIIEADSGTGGDEGNKVPP
jgi:anti-anti-sigma factor